MDVDLEFSW